MIASSHPYLAGPRPRLCITARLPVTVVLLLLLAGCNAAATLPPQPTATALAAPAAPADSGEEEVLPVDQLVVWLPPLSGFAADGNAGVVLENAFVQFEQQHPGIRLDVQVKAETGTASLLNYLRNAQQAAPTVLPDLVLINTQQLWQLVDLGLVQPIDEDEIMGDVDFFGVGRTAVSYRDQSMGVPYALDIVHLVYDSAATPVPPVDWTALREEGRHYLFPGAESAAPSELLQQYVGAGGVLRDDGAIGDATALQAYFDHIATARSNEVIPFAVVDLADYPSTWRAFSADPQSLAAVQVNQYLPNAAGTSPPGYSPIPTRTGAASTVADTWAFALLTPDPTRQDLAMALVNTLLAPEVHGPWSQFAARLPTHARALAMWTQSDDYRTFLKELLDNAQAPPNGLAFAEFARRLQSTRAGLIRGDVTVEEAMQLMAATE